MSVEPLRLANPQRVVMQAFADAIAPPPPVDFERWAVDNVRFGTESEFQGPYNPDLFRPFSEILIVLSPDHPSRVVVFVKSAQLGGTVVAEIFVGGSMDLAPGPMLYTHPTNNNAIRWVKTKWGPFERQNQKLKKILTQRADKDGSRTYAYIERRDFRGSLIVSGANSEADLSMISVTKQVQDDLAKWEPNKAGDSEEQADSRSEAFTRGAKIFKVSTPLIMPGCRITRAYERSDQRRYHIKCPECGHEHSLEWENFRGSIENATKGLSHEEIARKAYFTCPANGCVIEQRHRAALISNGRWIAENPSSSIPGFYLWSAYSPLTNWTRIAAKWLKAKGDPTKEQTFYNDTLGLAYHVEGDAPEWEAVRDRAESSGFQIGQLPPGGWILTAGIDCQKDRVEVKFRAHGRNLRAHTFETRVIEGHISDDEARKAVRELLNEEWTDAAGNKRRLDGIGIDAGYAKSDVLDAIKGLPRGRAIALKGSSNDLAPEIGTPTPENIRKNGKKIKGSRLIFPVGVSVIKASFYKRLHKTDPLARGYVSYAEGLGDEHFQQTCAERRVAKKNKQGVEVWQWENFYGRNEMLDCEIYAEAVAIRLGWKKLTDEQWDAKDSEWNTPPAAPQLDLEDPEFLQPRVKQAVETQTDAAPTAPQPSSAPAQATKPSAGDSWPGSDSQNSGETYLDY